MKTLLPILSLAAIPSLLSAEVVDGNKGELVQRDAKFLGPPATVEGDVKPQKVPKELDCAKAAPPTAINPAFDTNLYQQLGSSEGNVFFSPYSITECMGMVYLGSDANTAKELGAALHLGDQNDFGDRMQFLRHHVTTNTNQKDNKLNIANAICVTGGAPDAAYQKRIRQMFAAEMFQGGLAEINGWVHKKTEGNIEKILEELSPNSACVLLNAVYFKGNWQTPFKSSKTRNGLFHVTADKSVKTKLMNRRGSYAVVRGEGWIAVELPYQTTASMVLILPDKPGGMADLETGLNEAMLQDVRERLNAASANPEFISLVMPKFKIETSYDLIPSFKKMGIKDAFSEKSANFSKMYSDNSVFISQIKHKATLEVDEMGSVASAATAVEMTKKSAAMPRPAPEIRFDRPFVALIQDRKTQSTLFMGRINDPTAK